MGKRRERQSCIEVKLPFVTTLTMLIVPFYRWHASHVLHATVASNISLVICLIHRRLHAYVRIVTRRDRRRLLRYYRTTTRSRSHHTQPLPN